MKLNLMNSRHPQRQNISNANPIFRILSRWYGKVVLGLRFDYLTRQLFSPSQEKSDLLAKLAKIREQVDYIDLPKIARTRYSAFFQIRESADTLLEVFQTLKSMRHGRNVDPDRWDAWINFLLEKVDEAIKSARSQKLELQSYHRDFSAAQGCETLAIFENCFDKTRQVLQHIRQQSPGANSWRDLVPINMSADLLEESIKLRNRLHLMGLHYNIDQHVRELFGFEE